MHDRHDHPTTERTGGEAHHRPGTGPVAAAHTARVGPGLVAAVAAVALLALPHGLAAQHGHDHDHGAEGDGHAHAGLHFSHPIIAETVTPDTKVRVDHQHFDYPGDTRENSGLVEAEYAFSPSFSVEAALPYSYSSSAVGNATVLFKFANRAFEDDGLIMGYGVELGLPTNGGAETGGHEHEHGEDGHTHQTSAASERFPVRFHGATGVRGTLGTDTWEIGPYLNVGWKSGALELMGWGVFGIPFNHADQSEVGTEISWNFSALVHASSRLQPMLELDGTGGISGHAVGEDVVQVSPGLKVRPLAGEPIWIGTSVGFPLASGMEEDPFDARFLASVFWHF